MKKDNSENKNNNTSNIIINNLENNIKNAGNMSIKNYINYEYQSISNIGNKAFTTLKYIIDI